MHLIERNVTYISKTYRFEVLSSFRKLTETFINVYDHVPLSKNGASFSVGNVPSVSFARLECKPAPYFVRASVGSGMTHVPYRSAREGNYGTTDHIRMELSTTDDY
jgi:hypothetical protein